MEGDDCQRQDSASVITFGYWNINGHTSKYLGDKLLDEEFLDIVSVCDVVGLGEIQSLSIVDIPGYKNVKQKFREKRSAGPKIPGGLGVFVRNELIDSIELVPNSCEDSIWIKIKKEDTFIGTYYVSPKYSKSRDIDFFNTLNDEIAVFQGKGNVFIQGDLNARTGSEEDFVQSGKRHDALLEVEEMDGDDDSSSIDYL